MGLSIAVIVGSLRAESYNRRLAEAMISVPSGADHEFRFVEIGDLPLYDQDDDKDQAPTVRRMKDEINAADAVIFVTPEFNRSLSGVLKNAIDHGSRPYGKSCWLGKPAGVAGTSPGQSGSAMAQQHLRNILSSVQMPTLQGNELYIVWKPELVDDDGKAAGDFGTFLDNWMMVFTAFVERNRA